MKFVAKIKTAIKRKSNKKLTSIETALQDENIRSKYTRDELEASLEGARRFKDAFDRQGKASLGISRKGVKI